MPVRRSGHTGIESARLGEGEDSSRGHRGDAKGRIIIEWNKYNETE